MAGSGGRHDVKELVLVDAFDDFADIFGGEFQEAGIDVGGDNAVLVQLSFLCRVHWLRVQERKNNQPTLRLNPNPNNNRRLSDSCEEI